MTLPEVLGARARYLRADLLGWSAAELAQRAGVPSDRILRREEGLDGGPSERVLRELLGERARRGVQGAIDAWSFEEFVEDARKAVERLSKPAGRAA